jgi:GNAT superfamily N-acetyltransferase
MLVRRATLADLEAVIAIDPISVREVSRRALLETAFGQVSGGGPPRRGEETPRRMAHTERTAACWVAEPAGSPIGFVILEYSFYGHGFVPLLVVQRTARRQGVGRALMEHVASVCTTPKLFTSTNESNAAMRSLLARLGFEPSGVIYNLDPGDPELVYVLRLR